MKNSIIYALDKARHEAEKLCTSPPPPSDSLDENLHVVILSSGLVHCAVGREACVRVRVWDSSASRGMTKVDKAVGARIPGPSVKVSTGNKVVQSASWYAEDLPHGKSMHIGLEHTADTISAGQANSEHGIGASWLTLEQHPTNELAPAVLHSLWTSATPALTITSYGMDLIRFGFLQLWPTRLRSQMGSNIKQSRDLIAQLLAVSVNCQSSWRL